MQITRENSVSKIIYNERTHVDLTKTINQIEKGVLQNGKG